MPHAFAITITATDSTAGASSAQTETIDGTLLPQSSLIQSLAMLMQC
jgi:hypothetical protein